jgi:hypothetical protein
MPVQDGNIEDAFQIIITVMTDIGIGARRFKQAIPFFPDPDGMGFDA